MTTLTDMCQPMSWSDARSVSVRVRQEAAQVSPGGSWVGDISQVVNFGIGLLRERLEAASLKASVKGRVTSPLLGKVPYHEDDFEVGTERLARVVYEVPDCRIAESIRKVRTSLKHGSVLDMSRSILVTSAGIGDGKSTIAANLAAGSTDKR